MVIIEKTPVAGGTTINTGANPSKGTAQDRRRSETNVDSLFVGARVRRVGSGTGQFLDGVGG